MKSWNSWLLSLGFAGWCLACAGCGGGDVPDPDADENAAAEPAAGPAGPDAGPAGAAAPAVAQNEAAAAAPAEAPGAATIPGAPGPAGPAGKAAPAVAEAEAAPVLENSSSAAQMLALGNRPPPAAAPAEGAPAEGSAASVPGGPAGPGGIPGASGSSEAQRNVAIPANPTPGSSAEMAAMYAAEAAKSAPGPGAAAPGGAPSSAYPGGEGGNPGEGANEPADFSSPEGAVKAWLNALRAKDPERLAEATAMRAPTEAVGVKNQKLFSSILEQSLTEDDLNDLANKLEGYEMEDFNQPRSTAKFSIILGKTTENGYFRRTITARREKNGWKVLDVSGVGTVAGRNPAARGRTR